jgi:hypothetical protein
MTWTKRFAFAAGRENIPQLQALRLPRSAGPVNLFHIFYTPLFAPWRRDFEILDPKNILCPMLLQTYGQMRKDTLRLQVVGHTAVKEVPKTVMRERLRRRVREGFTEAFRQMGYDRNGNLLQPALDQRKPVQDLRGTLEIHCRGRSGLDCEFVEIVNLAKEAISAVDRSLTKSNATQQKVGCEPWWRWRWGQDNHDSQSAFSSLATSAPETAGCKVRYCEGL